MQAELLSFKYLWDGSTARWALLNIGTDDEARYLIVNTETKSAKIISDDQLSREVVNQMLNANVRVVSRGNGF